MTPADGQPKYLHIAADLREKIRAGEYRVGGRLPPLDDLASTYDAAPNTIRSALAQLRDEGVTQSFQGLGTIVKAAPAPKGTADRRSALVQRVGELAEEVHHLTGRVESLESAGIRAALERLELTLIDLYGKLGYDYPREDTAEGGESSSKAAAHGNRA